MLLLLKPQLLEWNTFISLVLLKVGSNWLKNLFVIFYVCQLGRIKIEVSFISFRRFLESLLGSFSCILPFQIRAPRFDYCFWRFVFLRKRWTFWSLRSRFNIVFEFCSWENKIAVEFFTRRGFDKNNIPVAICCDIFSFIFSLSSILLYDFVIQLLDNY